MKKRNHSNFKYFFKHFFSLKLNSPETGKKFKCFNVSSKMAIAGFFSGYLAFLVFLMFFLGVIAHPARAKIRRKLLSGKNKKIEYSLLEEIEILGHRGVRKGAPENTLKAIELAHKGGAHGVEFDVRFTKDSKPMLMHDSRISRTVKGKKGREKSIRNLTYSQIAKMKTGGESIPTLEQALKLIKKLDLVANIEIKKDSRLKKSELKKVIELSNKYCNPSKLSISSFDENIISYIKSKKPNTITGYISYGVEFDWLQKAKKAKADYVNFHLMGLQLNSLEKIILCKQNNFAIKTWPVNDLKTANELISAGIDGIISDNPKVLMPRHS